MYLTAEGFANLKGKFFRMKLNFLEDSKSHTYQIFMKILARLKTTEIYSDIGYTNGYTNKNW